MPRKPKRIKKQEIPAEDIQFEKVFIRGEVGKGSKIINELEKVGGKNMLNLGGNNPYRIYYLGKDGVIHFVNIDSPEAYILLHSDWEELVIK